MVWARGQQTLELSTGKEDALAAAVIEAAMEEGTTGAVKYR
jgi:hypothetical protein